MTSKVSTEKLIANLREIVRKLTEKGDKMTKSDMKMVRTTKTRIRTLSANKASGKLPARLKSSRHSPTPDAWKLKQPVTPFDNLVKFIKRLGQNGQKDYEDDAYTMAYKKGVRDTADKILRRIHDIQTGKAKK